MAVQQITDFYLNNQKRFTESAVMTVPARLGGGDTRLGTGPRFIDPADTYQAYCLPKNSLVREFYVYVREAFEAGTTASVTTIVGGEVLVTDVDVATEGLLVLSTTIADGALFNVADGFAVSFNQSSQVGALQVIAKYTSLDETSGKYIAKV